ncbi:MAG: 2-C-methyl-D-erythritol 4-phosphate cytidylyltransferase [Planctomycetes bacterium]|nr:2-C-methyl-D-erythritol 4-phosphate cytidylyltransferase [Planctomycetota bacterium]
MKVCVIIPAAGRSSRFGESDKLLQDIGGRPMLIRTVEIFSKRDEVDRIIVAGPPDDMDRFRERFGATLGFLGAVVVEGGRADRWETVRNALVAVPENATHIAVHDAARPGTDKALLDRIFEAAQSQPAVVPGVRINATVKRISPEVMKVKANEEDGIADSILGGAGRIEIRTSRVLETISRENLVEIQTPQVFKADLLKRAYAQDNMDGATDDASLVERLNEAVYVIDGNPGNIKITTPDDLKLMRAILGVKPPSQRPAHKQF